MSIVHRQHRAARTPSGNSAFRTDPRKLLKEVPVAEIILQTPNYDTHHLHRWSLQQWILVVRLLWVSTLSSPRLYLFLQVIVHERRYLLRGPKLIFQGSRSSS